MSDKFIAIEGITRRFAAPGGDVTTVFENLWLSMARGEFTCIIGHSGCGKTTVLNLVAGLDEPSEGTVIVDNQAIEGPMPWPVFPTEWQPMITSVLGVSVGLLKVCMIA